MQGCRVAASRSWPCWAWREAKAWHGMLTDPSKADSDEQAVADRKTWQTREGEET